MTLWKENVFKMQIVSLVSFVIYWNRKITLKAIRLVQALTCWPLRSRWQPDYKSQCHLAVRPLNHTAFPSTNMFTMVTKISQEHDTLFLDWLNFSMPICGWSLFTLIKVMTCFCRQALKPDLISKTNIST